jgi:predicted esterase
MLPGLLAIVLGLSLPAPQGKAEVPSQEITIRGVPRQQYFLHGPKKEGAPPKEGYGLLVVLPGGNGGRDFRGFVGRIYAQALGNDWIAAQPISVKWTDKQRIVWPTAKNRAPKMKFTTEEFVDRVIVDVAKRQKVDPRRILLLAWSSGGPAAYTISLQERKHPTGFYIAMSVFRPQWLPSLAQARGEVYFLDHSPDDAVCDFALAKEAERLLTRQGAKVQLVTYEGGHGWHGDVFGRLRKGFAWLEKNRGRPSGKGSRKR